MLRTPGRCFILLEMDHLSYKRLFKISYYLVGPCASNPCKNGGKCLTLRKGKKYRCKCKTDYIGKTCEKKKKGKYVYLKSLLYHLDLRPHISVNIII